MYFGRLNKRAWLLLAAILASEGDKKGLIMFLTLASLT